MKVVLFYGQSGTGKTTLAKELKNYIKTKFPNLRVEHIDGDEFRKELNDNDYSKAGRVANLVRLLLAVDFAKKHGDVDYLILSFVCPIYEVRKLLQLSMGQNNTALFQLERKLKGINEQKKMFQIEYFDESPLNNDYIISTDCDISVSWEAIIDSLNRQNFFL